VTAAHLTPEYYAEYWESVAAPGLWTWIVHERANPSPNLGKGVWTGTAESERATQEAIEALAKTLG
jgi:hypothetical protein